MTHSVPTRRSSDLECDRHDRARRAFRSAPAPRRYAGHATWRARRPRRRTGQGWQSDWSWRKGSLAFLPLDGEAFDIGSESSLDRRGVETIFGERIGALGRGGVMVGFEMTRHRATRLSREIGRAHVCTPVTNAHLVCRLLLEKKNTQ